MSLLDQIKNFLGMGDKSPEAIDQVPPPRDETTTGAPPASGGSSDMPADLPRQPETEPYDPNK